jgi:hypothetical protein
MRIFTSFCLTSIIIFSCSTKQENQSAESVQEIKMESKTEYPQSLNDLTKAHNMEAFNNKEVIAFDIELYFRGNLRLDGTIYSRTNSTKVLVEKKDGVKLFFDGSEVYISPDSADTKGVRFDALTWQYFALAPFKFKDEGTNWEENDSLPLDIGKQKQPTLKLTFGEGIGDAPDDWYIVFQYDDSHLLKAMAYIVTFGNTPQEKAEKNPHAIVYDSYTEIDGVQMATEWSFHNWSFETGLGEQLGKASISNIRFTKETEDLFGVENKKMVPLP